MIQYLKNIQNICGTVRACQREQISLSANPVFSRKGSTFNVEIRKNCKICGRPITIKRYRTFCSKKCRTKSYTIKYKETRAKWQLARYDEIASIKSPHKIQCLICGKWYVQVGSHIWNRHKMTAREYRKLYGFDVKKGQLPGWYKEIKSDQAFESGTIKNLKSGKRFWFRKGQPGVGVYERSPETMFRLHNLHKFNKRICQN
jgi:predicted nucleic acid-binding Zn ribbon protein